MSTNQNVGGYPSGNKSVSELKPPPANITRSLKPANELRAALLDLVDKAERKDGLVPTQAVRDLIDRYNAPSQSSKPGHQMFACGPR